MKHHALPLVFAAVLAASCSSPEPGPVEQSADTGSADGGADADGNVADMNLGPYPCAAHARLGPHPVGVRTTQIGSATVELFYPAARAGTAYDAYDLRDWMPPEDQDKIPDGIAPLFEFPAYRDVAPAADAFPVVLFSHGFGGYRLQSSVLVSTIASWGYVVVAPEHPERDLTAVLNANGVPMDDFSAATLIEVLDALEADPGIVAPSLDLAHVAVAGHSAGGFAAVRVGDDPRLSLVVGWAAAGFDDAPAFDTPSVLISGGVDRIASAVAGRQLYDTRTPPKMFSIIDNAGHLAFSDICLIGRKEGGVLAIAQENGVRVPAILQALGKDGCLPQDRPAEDTWPLIEEITITELEHRLRDGPALDIDATTACFGELVEALESE